MPARKVRKCTQKTLLVTLFNLSFRRLDGAKLRLIQVPHNFWPKRHKSTQKYAMETFERHFGRLRTQVHKVSTFPPVSVLRATTVIPSRLTNFFSHFTTKPKFFTDHSGDSLDPRSFKNYSGTSKLRFFEF